LRFMEHDVLHAALGAGLDLVDHEYGARRRRGNQHDRIGANENDAHE